MSHKLMLLSVFALLLITSLALTSAQQQNNYPYNCGYGMMGNYFGSAGSSFYFIFMLIFWILIIVALVLLIAWLVKQLKKR